MTLRNNPELDQEGMSEERVGILRGALIKRVIERLDESADNTEHPAAWAVYWALLFGGTGGPLEAQAERILKMIDTADAKRRRIVKR